MGKANYGSKSQHLTFILPLEKLRVSTKFCLLAVFCLVVLGRGCTAVITTQQNTNVEFNKTDLQALLEVKAYLSKYGGQSVLASWQGTSCASPYWLNVLCDSQGHVTLVDLQNMGLSVPIAPIINSLSRLSYLNALALASNNLSGKIPSSIGKLTKLNYLLLFNNKLSGEIPTTINNLATIFYIDMHNNSLSGKIPPIDNLKNLGQLFLGNNKLSGNVPPLQNLKNLFILSLKFNKLTGLIPDLTNLGLAQIELNDNLLSGPLSLSTQGAFGSIYLDVSNNFLSGLPSLPLSPLSNCTALANNCFTFNSTNRTSNPGPLPPPPPSPSSNVSCAPKQKAKSVCEGYCNAYQPMGVCGGAGVCVSVRGKSACKCKDGYSTAKDTYTCVKSTLPPPTKNSPPPKSTLSPPPKPSPSPPPKKFFPPPKKD